MKTINIITNKTTKILFLVGLIMISVLFILSCKKDKLNNGNDLNGEVNIALTDVGNTTDVYASIGGVSIPGELEVIDRTSDGIVTYHGVLDYSSLPEAGLLDDLINDDYQDGPGKVKADFKLKITSEGYMDYLYPTAQDKPFLAFRYNDAVGTNYQVTQPNGNILTRTVVHKSTDDDFYWGGLIIKTITVEQNFSASDPIAKKLTIRGNHKFGLVNVQLELKDGKIINLILYPTNY